MSEPTQPNPVAVPWSPDAPVQNAPSPLHAPAPSLPAPAPLPSSPQQPFAPPAAPPGPTPYMGHPASQPAMLYGQPQMAQPLQPAFHAAPTQNSQSHTTYARAAAGQYPPAQNTHGQPYTQANFQVSPQSPTAHMQLNRGQPGTMPPLLAPHMQQATNPPSEGPTKSKNLLQKLFKRSSKAEHKATSRFENRMAGVMPGHPVGQGAVEASGYAANHLHERPQPPEPSLAYAGSPSRSFFNKNFVMGTVTGIIIGAFVLPMIINLFVSDSSPESYAQSPSTSEEQTGSLPGAQVSSDITLSVPASSEGQTFLDAAIAADEP